MKRRERGANLAEFAVVVPLVLLLLLGAADFGRVYNAYLSVTNAAREGARIASRYPCYNDTDSTSYADQRAKYRALIVAAVNGELTDSGVSLSSPPTITPKDPKDGACPDKGTPITIEVEAAAELYFGSLIGQNSFTLRNSATMLAVGNDQDF